MTLLETDSVPADQPLTTTQQLQLLLSQIIAGQHQPCSLHEIAAATGLSVQTLAKLVNGQTQEPRLDTLRRLCQFYGISLDYFAGESAAACQAYLRQQRLTTAAEVIQEIAHQTQHLSQRSQD